MSQKAIREYLQIQQTRLGTKARHHRRSPSSYEKGLPFPLLGVDSDNGPEFLNWHLLTLWRDRIPAIEITRSWPYHKNDNAHIKQKTAPTSANCWEKRGSTIRIWLLSLSNSTPSGATFITSFCPPSNSSKKNATTAASKRSTSRKPAPPAAGSLKTGLSVAAHGSP